MQNSKWGLHFYGNLQLIMTGHWITLLQLTLNTERPQTKFCFDLIHHHSFLIFKHGIVSFSKPQ